MKGVNAGILFKTGVKQIRIDADDRVIREQPEFVFRTDADDRVIREQPEFVFRTDADDRVIREQPEFPSLSSTSFCIHIYTKYSTLNISNNPPHESKCYEKQNMTQNFVIAIAINTLRG